MWDVAVNWVVYISVAMEQLARRVTQHPAAVFVWGGRERYPDT